MHNAWHAQPGCDWHRNASNKPVRRGSVSVEIRGAERRSWASEMREGRRETCACSLYVAAAATARAFSCAPALPWLASPRLPCPHPPPAWTHCETPRQTTADTADIRRHRQLPPSLPSFARTVGINNLPIPPLAPPSPGSPGVLPVAVMVFSFRLQLAPPPPLLADGKL